MLTKFPRLCEFLRTLITAELLLATLVIRLLAIISLVRNVVTIVICNTIITLDYTNLT